MKLTTYDGTAISGMQPQKNMGTMEKVDTSDWMIIIRLIINIFQSPKLKWASLAHTTPHIVKKIGKVIKRTSYILDTLSIEYTQQAFTHSSRIFHRTVFNASE